jgi:PadR family transcriptional regulator, regulatory protein PadR
MGSLCAGVGLTVIRNGFTIYEDMPRHLLTDFELMLVVAILRIGDGAYGVQIAREIEATGGRRVLLGAAYAALDRLERNGLVGSRVGAPTSERGGRARRFFHVTARGVRAAQDTQQALVAMWRGVPQLKERRT